MELIRVSFRLRLAIRHPAFERELDREAVKISPELQIWLWPRKLTQPQKFPTFVSDDSLLERPFSKSRYAILSVHDDAAFLILKGKKTAVVWFVEELDTTFISVSIAMVRDIYHV